MAVTVTAPAPLRRRVAAFDRTVDGWFDHVRGHPVADRVFYGASALGDHSLVWLILGTARGLRSEHAFRATIRDAAAIAAESALVNGVIKSFFRRTRPAYEAARRPLPLRQPRTSSFPSGHATAGFCAAALLGENDPLWPAYYALALVVAWSRVYVKVHHPSDVVAGIAVGAALGRLARRLAPLDDLRPAESR